MPYGVDVICTRHGITKNTKSFHQLSNQKLVTTKPTISQAGVAIRRSTNMAKSQNKLLQDARKASESCSI